jgi:transmembrane sensor
LPDKEFNGLISRNVKLSEVLRALEMTSNVRFKIEGRRLTIE